MTNSVLLTNARKGSRRRKRSITWSALAPASLSVTPTVLSPLDYARRLDREADAELGMGHIEAAERLAHRAAELRGQRV